MYAFVVVVVVIVVFVFVLLRACAFKMHTTLHIETWWNLNGRDIYLHYQLPGESVPLIKEKNAYFGLGMQFLCKSLEVHRYIKFSILTLL